MQSMIRVGNQGHTKSKQKMKRQRSFRESKSREHSGMVAFMSVWPLKVYGLRLGADLPYTGKILMFCANVANGKEE